MARRRLDVRLSNMPKMRRIVRVLCAAGILSVGIWILHYAILNSPGAVVKDSIQYWASSKLLLAHSNPYNRVNVFRLERWAGVPIGHGGVTPNPPFALFLTLPLGFFAPRTAIFLWALMIIAAIVISVRVLWLLNGRPPDRLHLLGYVFAPVVACVPLGQILPFELLGVTLFLWLNRTYPLLAGLGFALLTIKPQLLIPFGIAAILWGAVRKQYAFLVGVFIGTGILFSVPFYFDPHIVIHYLPIIHFENAYTRIMPNYSTLLHRLDPGVGFLQYALAVGAGCWAIWWFLRRGDRWDWNNEGLLLIMISVIAAPYYGFEDEALVLPAILSAIYLCADSGILLTSYGFIDGAALLLVVINVKFYSGAYIWTGVAWLCWYCYVRYFSRASAAMKGDNAKTAAMLPGVRGKRD